MLVLLPKCFAVCRAGIFGKGRWGLLGTGMLQCNGELGWCWIRVMQHGPRRTLHVTLGKCAFHGVQIHPFSPLNRVLICSEEGLKAILQCCNVSPKVPSHQVIHLNTKLATQQQAQRLPMQSSHITASPNPSRSSEELLAKEVWGICWLEARQEAHAAEHLSLVPACHQTLYTYRLQEESDGPHMVWICTGSW